MTVIMSAVIYNLMMMVISSLDLLHRMSSLRMRSSVLYYRYFWWPILQNWNAYAQNQRDRRFQFGIFLIYTI